MPTSIGEQIPMELGLHEGLLKLNRVVCRHLWNMRPKCEKPVSDTPLLIFPQINNGVTSGTNKTKRISEQEARFIFAHVLDSHNSCLKTPYAYSIETPTICKHSFKGNGKISAQFDMSLYAIEDDGYRSLCNVEFKAGQPAHVWQDFYKLIKDTELDPEHPCGHYFHLLESADSGTLPALLKKFREAFEDISKKMGDLQKMQFSIFITICILNLDKQRGKWACSKLLYCDGQTWSESMDNISSSLSLYGTAKTLDEQRKCMQRNGWKIITPATK